MRMAQLESFHRDSQITTKTDLFVANTLTEENITQVAWYCPDEYLKFDSHTSPRYWFSTRLRHARRPATRCVS